MDKNKNQGLENQNKEVGRPNKEDYKERIRKNEPVMDNNPSGKDKSSDASQQKSGSQEQAGEWKRPLTNQDESRKETNVGGKPGEGVGEEESEGDKRIEPYKNIGDDSEEVQKNTPTME